MGRGSRVPFLAGVIALVCVASEARAALPGTATFTNIDLTRGLHLTPKAQLDDPMSFLPKGDQAGDPWDWPIVLGQWAASCAVSVGGAVLFDKLSTPAAGATTDQVKKQLITYGVIQFLTVPLVSATSVWLVGNADEFHDYGYGFPLLGNYIVELALIAAKIGINIGGLKGGDAADLAGQVAGKDAAFLIIRAIVVPTTVTYLAIRMRGPKGMSFTTERETAPVPFAVLPATRSVASVRETESQGPVAMVPVQLPLVAAAF